MYDRPTERTLRHWRCAGTHAIVRWWKAVAEVPARRYRTVAGDIWRLDDVAHYFQTVNV